MKKNEWIIIGVIAAVAVIALLVMNLNKKNSGNTGETASPSAGETIDPNAKGMVNILYHNKVVQQFDPNVDAMYHVDGDYGGLYVEVKDGKWHVTNEECPNHICANMGWVDIDEIIPITCLPNGITIYPAGE